mmetsp:Transcript_13651/g.17461  ORF Transcript_13651/g.17461 Transcript_13651/m.17461 type:complete len:650 (-) Transcript_13651:300-2249(-)
MQNEESGSRRKKLQLDMCAMEPPTAASGAENAQEMVTALSEREALDSSIHNADNMIEGMKELVQPAHESRRQSLAAVGPIHKLDISHINACNQEGTAPTYGTQELVTALSEREALQDSFRSLAEPTRSTESDGLPPLRSNSSGSLPQKGSARRVDNKQRRGSTKSKNSNGEAPPASQMNGARRRSRQSSMSRLMNETAASRAQKAEKFSPVHSPADTQFGGGARSVSSLDKSGDMSDWKSNTFASKMQRRSKDLPPVGDANTSSLPSIENNSTARSNAESEPEPFCELCNQGFQTIARLNNHVRFSAVHEINVKKKLEAAIQNETASDPLSARQEEHLMYEGSKLFWRCNKNLDIHIYVASSVMTIVAYCPEKQKEYPRLFMSLNKVRQVVEEKMQEAANHQQQLEAHSNAEPRRRASNPIEMGAVGPVKAKRRGSFMQQIEAELSAKANPNRNRTPSPSLENAKTLKKAEKIKATDEDISKFILTKLDYVEADPANNIEESVIITGPEDFGLISKAAPDKNVKRGTKIPRRRRSTITDYRKEAQNFVNDIDGVTKHRDHAASLHRIVNTTMETLEALLNDGRRRSKGKQRFKYAAKRVMFNNAYMQTRIFLESKDAYREWLKDTKQIRRHTSRSTPLASSASKQQVGF